MDEDAVGLGETSENNKDFLVRGSKSSDQALYSSEGDQLQEAQGSKVRRKNDERRSCEMMMGNDDDDDGE